LNKASSTQLRLVFAHDGTSPYDSFFLKRLSSQFQTYLLTFTTPANVPDGTRTVRLSDFGKPSRIRKLDKLRIAVGTFWRIVQFRVCLGSLEPDIVIGNYVTTYGLYASACRWRPFILFAYGSDVVVEPGYSPLHRWITTLIVRSADLVIVDSEVQRRAVLSLGCFPEKIVSFPWVDLNDFRKTTSDPSFRRRLGWNGKTIVVSVRNHEPQYSVDTLIRAVPSMLKRFSNLRFLIFGTGTLSAQLIRLAHELEVEQFVHFAGSVPRGKLLGYLKDCDIYLSTSLSDGTSASLLEAMFLGVPVVVTSVDGNAEWISEGINGLTFEARDSDGLARAVLRLANNPAERKQIALKAMEDIVGRVDWQRASSELVRRMRDAWAKQARSLPQRRSS